MMSISYIPQCVPSKEMPSEIRLYKSIWCQIHCLNCHKPEYRYMNANRMSKIYSILASNCVYTVVYLL